MAHVNKKKPGTFCPLFFDSSLLSSDMINQIVGSDSPPPCSDKIVISHFLEIEKSTWGWHTHLVSEL